MVDENARKAMEGGGRVGTAGQCALLRLRLRPDRARDVDGRARGRRGDAVAAVPARVGERGGEDLGGGDDAALGGGVDI